MSDALLRQLAARSGIETEWVDQTGTEHVVAPDTLRAVLAALGVEAGSAMAIYHALSFADERLNLAAVSRFTTARVGRPVTLPVPATPGARIEVTLEGGARRVVTAHAGVEGAMLLPPLEVPGYHVVHLVDGGFTVATAPERCTALQPRAGNAGGFGFSAQVYALRTPMDGGIGGFAGVAALARVAARAGADALVISPVHALYGATPTHFSPYSPSTRLFYNPLHADPCAIFPLAIVQQAIAALGIGAEMEALSAAPLIDWERASRTRQRLLRRLYHLLMETPALGELRTDFEQAVAGASIRLRQHALFEALHADQLAHDANAWNWRDWAPGYRRPDTAAAREFAARHDAEIRYQIFLQWLTGWSFGEAQRVCRDNGMGVGLIADLAIGIDSGGSHAWSRQHEVLHGLSVGAPPDHYAPQGQDWGVTSFAPNGLAATGYAPFIETLRANLRYAGGVRIDHVMGLTRLWVIPDGARATEGAYLDFSSETLFRLVALESYRYHTMVLGEDLGTLPEGFRPYLRQQGIMGQRVLRFEKDDHRHYPPAGWDPTAAALTTTHDLVSTAGWWMGSDLDDGPDRARTEQLRDWNRGILWSSLERAGATSGARPAPDTAAPVVDAAIRYVAQTPCALKLVAMEDMLALPLQPNVPGTTTEKPNWRHRLPGMAATLLDAPAVQARIDTLRAGVAAPSDEDEE